MCQNDSQLNITKIATVLERVTLSLFTIYGSKLRYALREQFFHLRCQRTDLCEVILRGLPCSQNPCVHLPPVAQRLQKKNYICLYSLRLLRCRTNTKLSQGMREETRLLSITQCIVKTQQSLIETMCQNDSQLNITKIATVLERVTLSLFTIYGSKLRYALREQFFHLRCQRTDLCEVILRGLAPAPRILVFIYHLWHKDYRKKIIFACIL